MCIYRRAWIKWDKNIISVILLWGISLEFAFLVTYLSSSPLDSLYIISKKYDYLSIDNNKNSEYWQIEISP